MGELRAELVELRASLALEVRTRRLVVIDEEGRERIVGEVGVKADGYASLSVNDGAEAKVDLTATPGIYEEERPIVDLLLYLDGEVAGSFAAGGGREQCRLEVEHLAIMDDKGEERITAEVFNGFAMVKVLTGDGGGVDLSAEPTNGIDASRAGVNLWTEAETAISIWAEKNRDPEIVVDGAGGARAILDRRGVRIEESTAMGGLAALDLVDHEAFHALSEQVSFFLDRAAQK